MREVLKRLGFKRFRGGPYVNTVRYSPHIKYYNYDDIREIIENYRQEKKGNLNFLDVGGRFGEYKYLAEGFDYFVLEINKEIKGKEVIHGDICNVPTIQNEFYDVVFSNNVFEHLKEPWKAAEECARITKKGGLIICVAPFSWRYHPVPVDTFRYSHYGLKYLFERTNSVSTFFSGYDISKRRRDSRGGHDKRGLDKPPIDSLGGWRENWETVYAGYKNK